MMKRRIEWGLLAMVLVAGLALAVTAAARSVSISDAKLAQGPGGDRLVEDTIWFQGYLADATSGDPINATYNIAAQMYNLPAGGASLWGPETHVGVEITEGWFNIELGSVIGGLPAFDDPPYFLKLTVNGEALTPRLKVASVPSAFQASSADNDDGDWVVWQGHIVTGDSVGIGTYYPDDLLCLSQPWINQNNLIHFRPLILKGEGGEPDRFGEGSFIGGVYGSANEYVINAEADGWLMMGADNLPSFGITDSSSVFATIYYPLMGYPPGYLTVDGGSIGYYGAGFWSGQNYGDPHVVHADYYGASDYASAVYGDARTCDEWGIGGEFYGGQTGVSGIAEGDVPLTMYGVYGHVDNTGGGAACISIYGSEPETSTGTAWSGYFEGDVFIGGTLTGGGPVMKIDNPLDPSGEYLSHASVMSPEMMNVYNGNVVMDGSGEATVELPEWFEALNGEYRYQLTCVGGYAPVYIADEIAGNTFRIAGGNPGMKVSWMVTGVRQDAYAQEHPIAVEERKVGREQGRYLHPEAFGQPKTLAMSYDERLEQVRTERAAGNREAKRKQTEAREAAKARGLGKGWWKTAGR